MRIELQGREMTHLSFLPINTAGDQYKVAIIASRVLKTGAPGHTGRGYASHPSAWHKVASGTGCPVPGQGTTAGH